MDTFLFDKIIYGPVTSRRLGISLGVNLLPSNRKYCNFDCVYCECGLNDQIKGIKVEFPSRSEVYGKLETVLSEMSENRQKPDVITFAGNGEPTLHPEFNGIIDDTIGLRDRYFKDTAISVLSNSTMIKSQRVFEALMKVDNNIMKLDSGLNDTIGLINRPAGKYDIKDILESLKKFSGRLIIQTMFMKGIIEGYLVDNTTEKEIMAWEACIKEINPRKVMVYTIARNTPFDTLEKIDVAKLKQIAQRIEKLGIPVQVAE